MIKNKKGFTLVELLVAISILGVIMIMALPQISNIQKNNKKTKYKKYAESMVTSAKLYTDSYSEDMFGNNKSGCYDISYSAMKDKNLLKDIEVDGSTCNDSKTFIRVRKANDYYSYESSIYCKDKYGQEAYVEVLEENGCDGSTSDEEGPNITISDALTLWTKGKDASVTISLWDEYGMLENAKIRISWTKDGTPYGEVREYNFKNKRYSGKSETNALEYTFKIPQNETGTFVLTVTPVDVRDSVGNYQVNSVDSGEYKLDNTPPSVTNIINPSGGSATTPGLVLTYYGSDIGSGIARWRYSYNPAKGWINYASSAMSPFDSTPYTILRNQPVYISLCDNAGNCSEPSSTHIHIVRTLVK